MGEFQDAIVKEEEEQEEAKWQHKKKRNFSVVQSCQVNTEPITTKSTTKT